MLRTSLEKALNGNPRKLSCHGFRHYVNDHFINLRQDNGISLAIPDIDRLDILGHKPKDVNLATYRRAEKPLGPLYQAIPDPAAPVLIKKLKRSEKFGQSA